MQRIPNRFRAHNILKPGISRVTVGYIIDVLGSGNLLVSGAEITGVLRSWKVNPRCPSDFTAQRSQILEAQGLQP